jgi:hypothetical protein
MDVFHNDIPISTEGEGIIGTTIRSMQQPRFTHTVGQNRAREADLGEKAKKAAVKRSGGDLPG